MNIMKMFVFVTIPCGAIANVLSYWIFARLRSVGHPRLQWGMDPELYRLYWQIAPQHGWSRAPLLWMHAIFWGGCGALFFAKWN